MNIEDWLHGIGMAQYAEQFRSNEIDGEILQRLSSDDLKDIGVAPLGHRKKLLDAIAALVTTPGSSSATPVAPTTHPREAERRQLTVMFVDLVGSTALSARLDPEDMRELMRSYQNMVAGEIARFEGHVAQFLGDGVLAYFGWPRAHEDEAERAVRAALAVTAATARLFTPSADKLQTRIGIATGHVVVGDLIGEGAGQRHAVVGETPNLAARLQAMAEPGTVVIANSTRHLLGDLFMLHDLGLQDCKGLTAPTRAFAVLGEHELETRFAARHAGGIAPIVGRDQELGLLIERWNQAKAGEGQVILLSGEAGIGKSRIAEAVVDAVQDETHYLLRYQCSPYHTDSALYPVIQQLAHAAGFTANDSPDQSLDRLEALLAKATDAWREEAPLLAAMLGIDGTARYGASTLTPQQQRSRTLAALVDQLDGLARRKPVLWVFEDVHWIDPTTLELIELTLDRVQGMRVLALITMRPSFVAPFANHPVVTRLALNRLGRTATQAIVDRITGGKPLPEALLDEIAARTDGVPLFVEEMTKAVIESGLLREEGNAYHLDAPLSALAIPTTLHDSLMARLDRLHPLKEVAQTAAVIGRSFDHRSIAALTALPEAELADAMQRLVEAELIFRRGTPPEASYLFKHALVRDAAYESLLKAKRIALHGRLLEILEARGDAAPEIMAQHAETAGQTVKAIDYWRRAGEHALQRSANLEASRHFSQGIELIKSLPASPERDRKEFRLYLGLGPAIRALKGHSASETAQAFSRARDLIDADTDLAEQMSVLYGLWGVTMAGSAHAEGCVVASQALELVAQTSDADTRALAHRMLGETLWAMGDLPQARHYLERAIDLCDDNPAIASHVRFGMDNRVALIFLAWSLAIMGYPLQAREAEERLLAHSARVGHSLTIAWAQIGALLLAEWHRDPCALNECADKLMAYCTEHRIGLGSEFGRIGQGLAQCWRGNPASAIDAVRRALIELEVGHVLFLRPMHLGFLAVMHACNGEREVALAVLDEAIALADTTEERFFEPELHRQRGELLMGQDQVAAEDSLHRALSIARQQNARAWELRAAMSLARLWRDQGRRDEARELLAPVYDWFTEGFDTPDLKAAKALLDECGRA